MDQALDLDPAERPALLARSCPGDAPLHQAVERLLADIARADDGFLAGTAAADAAPLLAWVARQGLEAGARFGPYEILQPVGRGGMATVYLARDHKHHRRVAVKVLHPDIAAAVGREWFLREIEIAASLHHPHILPLHDSGTADGRLYYVMPYVEGESLRHRLAREGSMPLTDAARVLREVAGALDYAHRQGVVHRDIKPENILLQEGQAIVADFGIARAIATGVLEAGTADTIPAVGTPAYMSPEQAAGGRRLDGRTDVYALGCVVYEMLEGVPPFTGPTVDAVLAQHAADPAPPLRRVAPVDRRRVEPAIHRALAKAPADRFATAGELAQSLDAADSARAAPRSRRLLTAGVAIALAAGLAAAVIARTRERLPDGDPDLIAVLPFEPAASGRAPSGSGERVANLLAARLAGDSGVRASDPVAVAKAWRARAEPDGRIAPEAQLAAGRRVGAGRIVVGSVEGDSSRLVVTAALRTTTSGASLARDTVAGPADSLLVLLDRLAARLLALGAGRDSARLAAAPAVSLPALRAYLDGRNAYWQGRTDRASDLIQRATTLDSTFALAAFELLHLRRGGEDGDRARRLALAGRGRLVPADQVLLDISTGPFPTGPEWIDRWQRAAQRFPERAEPWYGLADAYFHDGLSAGVADPFRYAAEAFQRGWAVDSAEQQGRSPEARAPLLAEPVRHMVELAQMRGDTATVLRLTSRWLAADSTSAQGWYLRWHRAMARGEQGRRAFWAEEAAVDPTAFGRMFEFIESSGVGAADIVRSAELDTRYWEANGPAAGLFQRGMVALDAGRPLESGRLLAEIENAHTGVGGWRPQSWRLGEGGDAGVVAMALYWGGDTARAAAAVRRLAPLAAGRSLDGDPARDQLEARCLVAAWHAARGDWTYVDAAVRRLRGARVRGLHGWDSRSLAYYTNLCAWLLDAERATALRLPGARRALDSADVASRAFELWLPTLGANLVIARVAERQGDLAMAVRALRRRAGIYQAFPSWYLSSYLRQEGRVAALAGDTAGAVRAYRHYLALRPKPEPGVTPEVAEVRRRLLALSPTSPPASPGPPPR